jgi:ADP-ribosylglycohydrolase
MWAAALVASALATDTADAALRCALRVVPEHSRLAEALRGVFSLFAEKVSATDALDWVDNELGQYSWVHTINNAALISIGLLWGDSFMDAVGIAISGGRDTDSTAATVGSVFGALHGASAVPAHLVGTTHVHVRSSVRDFDRITIDELAQRTLTLAERFAPHTPSGAREQRA